MSAETAIQTALYAALNGATYAVAVTVYAAAPQASDSGSSASWPYIEMGFTALTEWDTKTETGHEFMARIHTRSRSHSMLEAKAIQGVIYDTLHRHPLTITGQTNIVLMRQTSMCDRAPDGTFHGVCEYRGLIQAT